MFVQAVEFRQIFPIPGPDLTDGVIHEPAPYRSTLLDKVQIVRAEKYRVDHLCKLSGGFFHAVYQNFFGIARAQLDVYGLVSVVAGYIGKNLRRREAKAHKLPVKAGTEAPAGGEHIDRLQQIGFSLSVMTGDYVCPASKFRRLPLIIAKTVQSDFVNFHSFVTSRQKRSNSTVSPGRIFFPRMVQTSPFTFTIPSPITYLASPPVPTSAANFSRESNLINSVCIAIFSIFITYQSPARRRTGSII